MLKPCTSNTTKSPPPSTNTHRHTHIHSVNFSKVETVINCDLQYRTGSQIWQKLAKEKKGRLEVETFYFHDERSHLEFSTVTLLSLLHVAVATLLSAVEHLDLWHVEQTHPHSFLKAGGQVLLAAAAEHRWERVPGSDRNTFSSREKWKMAKISHKKPIQSELISVNCC